MDQQRRIKGPTTTLLAVGCLSLLMLVLLNLYFGYRAQAAFDSVNASRETRTLAANLRSALQAAESSQRGYLLTNNEIYLAPFATAWGEAERAVLLLKDATGKQTASEAALQKLDAVVAEKLAELRKTVEEVRASRPEEALKIIATHRGKALMDEANVFISAIERAAERDLTDAVQNQQDSLRTLAFSTYLAVLLVFVVSTSIYLILRPFVSDLRRANEEIRSINETLESRVEERTQDLSIARDRAEMLLAEVNHRVANSLTMVASMVGMQARTTSDGDARRILSDTQARINAVATVHKQLYTTTEVRTIALNDFLPKLISDIQNSLRAEGLTADLTTRVEPLSLTTDQSINLGIILTEWVTNAFKYAYRDKAGEIRVSLQHGEAGQGILSVEDDGVGRGQDPVPEGTGLGSRLVQAMAAALGAEIIYRDRSPGTEARLVFPLAS